MKFRMQNYNEFCNGEVRWHDYFSIMINEFALILVRRYDFHDCAETTYHVQILGFVVLSKTVIE